LETYSRTSCKVFRFAWGAAQEEKKLASHLGKNRRGRTGDLRSGLSLGGTVKFLWMQPKKKGKKVRPDVNRKAIICSWIGGRLKKKTRAIKSRRRATCRPEPSLELPWTGESALGKKQEESSERPRPSRRPMKKTVSEKVRPPGKMSEKKGKKPTRRKVEKGAESKDCGGDKQRLGLKGPGCCHRHPKTPLPRAGTTAPWCSRGKDTHGALKLVQG